MKSINIPEGKVQCESCNGTGECCYSCCTGDIITGDILMCPDCHEHLGYDICETCDGVGYVDDNDNTPDKIDVQQRAEFRYELKND